MTMTPIERARRAYARQYAAAGLNLLSESYDSDDDLERALECLTQARNETLAILRLRLRLEDAPGLSVVGA